MEQFSPGTKVVTNEEYENNFGRRVIGVIVKLPIAPPNGITFVRWLHQEGNVIPEQQDNIVIMMCKSLKVYLAN